MEKYNLLNIVICIVLICAILIIITLERSKKVMEQFYQENNTGNVVSQPIENTNGETPPPPKQNNTVSVSREQARESSGDINEEQLKAMCENVNKGLEGSIKTLRLNILDLNQYVKPSFWYNESICFYRMDRLLSLNPNIRKENAKDDDYYYPLSDVVLFKNYDSFLKNENVKKEENNNNAESASPSPSMVPGNLDTEDTVLQGTLTLGDNRIDNYNQPGVDGLKLLVKNGKKPIAYSQTPVCVIPGANGENLYVWEPIPPENYICLGSVCSVSVRPVIPNVNNCPIRCVPKSCLFELDLNLSDNIRLPSIKTPYNLFNVSNGKFFKGMVEMPNQTGMTIKSHDVDGICDNTELDDSDKPISIKLHYKNTDLSGTGAPLNNLAPGTFNSVKGYFNKEFNTFLINKPELHLNDYPNNPPNPLLKPTGKRYLINSMSKTENKVTLYLSLNKRAYGYNQLSGLEMQQALSSMSGKHKISIRIFEKDYHLTLEKVDIASLYVFDPDKIDWQKTFIDPELVNEEEKVRKLMRGGMEYENDPFKFNKDMDSFLKISDNMESVELPSNSPA